MKRTLDISAVTSSPTYFLFGHYEDESDSSGLFFTPTTDLGRAAVEVLLTPWDEDKNTDEIRNSIYRFICYSDDAEERKTKHVPKLCKILKDTLPGINPASLLGDVVDWNSSAPTRIAGIPIEIPMSY